ncbi:hypothetical protein C0995_013558 [Termitomyces sp. Mi166|nr:hypothetical protein C0995_013558 [Termitomyces sp. Mi166\
MDVKVGASQVNFDCREAQTSWSAIFRVRPPLGRGTPQLRKRLKKAKENLKGNDLLPELAGAIHFAYLYAPSESTMEKIPKYLPTAFYHLARLPSKADADDATAREVWNAFKDFQAQVDGAAESEKTAMLE